LAEPLRLFLDNDPFTTARMLSRHFNVSATTVKEILARDLGMRKFTRRWVPHTLSDLQKVKRVETSTELFHILNELEVDSFDGITTDDESSFQYLSESSAMFAKWLRDVNPRTRPGIGVTKRMSTIVFANRKLLIAEDLPKGQKYSQDYFISDILPALEREKMRYKRRKQGGTCYAHMNHSKSHDGAKIQGKFDTKGLGRFPHPPYPPDLSPCDFWFLGMAKGKLTDREFHTVQQIRRRLTEIWNGLNFKDVQSVFLEWKIRFKWVIENGG
jgi:transposase